MESLLTMCFNQTSSTPPCLTMYAGFGSSISGWTETGVLLVCSSGLQALRHGCQQSQHFILRRGSARTILLLCQWYCSHRIRLAFVKHHRRSSGCMPRAGPRAGSARLGLARFLNESARLSSLTK
jgi:hypothetical protein